LEGVWLWRISGR